MTTPDRTADEILAARAQIVGPSLSVAYRRHPLKIVRGAGQYLYDDTGREFLDCVNNVCHVGHCHPRVVEAAAEQMRRLNTNTRYLHDHLVEYAERLGGRLPAPLDVCFFVCSGSEANELALRLARAATGARDVIVVEGAYHGTTTSLIDMSPYKYDGPGGGGRPPHVHEVPMPDVYRGTIRDDHPSPGTAYGQAVATAVMDAAAGGSPAAAFFCESLLSCGGQIPLPEGYLATAYAAVREGGGVTVADEVQVGFGRVGRAFWGFELQGMVPDIVTMGKPIGNGHPMGAVVTTREVADAFANGMEYFNTFGGNPVSCAVGLAVLDVIEEESLQDRALEVGSYLRGHLGSLATTHACIGDVRGEGLFLGVELVTDPEARVPDTALAGDAVFEMRERGILLSTDGPDENVIKIKPPLVFSHEDADRVVTELDSILRHLHAGEHR